jgi:NAD(P)-dependent dehydrogenase (short-subunit alcohol dehydrogenase family)
MDIAGTPAAVTGGASGLGLATAHRSVKANPGALDDYTAIIELNLIGSFNVLRPAAARIAATEPVAGERGVIVPTASVAAWEGQIGQIPAIRLDGGIRMAPR